MEIKLCEKNLKNFIFKNYFKYKNCARARPYANSSLNKKIYLVNNDRLNFRSDMVVRSIGNSLMVILPDLVGKKITYFFDLVRPLIAFKFQSVNL